MNWNELEVANEQSIEGERWRTTLLNSAWCAWSSVDGVPLMLGVASRGWARLLDVCLRHMFAIPDTAKLERPRDWPVQTCCLRHVDTVVSHWDLRPVTEQLLHLCVWYSPPSLFPTWDEWDCTLNCLPPIGDPGWATVFIVWQRHAVNADTILAWSIVLHRMRLERLAMLWPVDGVDGVDGVCHIETWSRQMTQMWSDDPYRTYYFEGNAEKLVDLTACVKQISQAVNK